MFRLRQTEKIGIFFFVCLFHFGLLFFVLHLNGEIQIRDDVLVVATIGQAASQGAAVDERHRKGMMYFPPHIKQTLVSRSSDSGELGDNNGMSTEEAVPAQKLDGEVYYRIDQLDRAAMPISDIELHASPLGLTSIHAIVEAYIDMTGKVRQARVLMVNPAEYAEEVRLAVLATTFSPAMRGGVVVNSIKVLDIAVEF